MRRTQKTSDGTGPFNGARLQTRRGRLLGGFLEGLCFAMIVLLLCTPEGNAEEILHKSGGLPAPGDLMLPSGLIAFATEAAEIDVEPGAESAHHAFSFRNVSSREVVFEKIETSCGCTVSSLKCPLKIAPGATGSIPVTMKVAGKTGTIRKTVTVYTDQGKRVLTIQAKIPFANEQSTQGALVPPKARGGEGKMSVDVMRSAAAADRQSVFKGDCASCHVAPGVGKYGKELYTRACGICHEDENRASMVKDLRKVGNPSDTGFWRSRIEKGVAKTLMPAFSETEGGPLSAVQIESLVDYLSTEFFAEPKR